MSGFKDGDRVRVKWDKAECFMQPWRGRFEKGCQGTVLSVNSTDRLTPIRVQWDHSKRSRPQEFRMNMYESDLELVEAAQ